MAPRQGLRGWLSRRTFDRIAQREGLPGLRARMAVLECFQRAPRERIEAHQRQQLARLLRHAAGTVPYYRELFAERGLDPERLAGADELKRLPRLAKEAIRDDFQPYVSTAFAAGDLHTSTTGGTTGARMRFARDHASRLPKEAALLMFESWAGWSIGEALGIVWPARIDYLVDPSWRAQLKNRLYRRELMLAAHELDDEILAGLVGQIERERPVALRGFASPLYDLADYLRRQARQLPPLRGVVSTGEPLYPQQRERMKAAFGCPVYDAYRSRELGPVAQECDCKEGLHINEHGLIVESIPADDGSGEAELVCTDLYNYGMPLIRYRTGDYGTVRREPCACGRTTARIVNLGGRLADVFVRRDGRTIGPGSIVLYLSVSVPGPLGQIQLVQEDYARFTLRDG